MASELEIGGEWLDKILLQGDDGFWTFWPRKGNGGYFDEWSILVIYRELRKRNEPLEKELEEYFEQEQKKSNQETICFDI